MERNVDISRRTALKGAVGLVGVGSVAALAATRGSGASLSFTANDPPQRTFDDGVVTAVTVKVTGAQLDWDGLDHDATHADVTLQAFKDDSWHDVRSIDVELNNRKDGSTVFDLGPVDLTGDASPYSDEDFTVDTDGATGTQTVPLRLDVVVNTEHSDFKATARDRDDLVIDVRNQPRSAGGSATSTTPTSYAGPVLDQAGEQTGDTAWLRLYYGADNIVVEMDLSEYQAAVSDGAPLNGAVGIDVNEDNSADYQLGWLPGVDGPTFAYKLGSESGWSEWKDAETWGSVTDVEEQGGVVRFTLVRSDFGIAPGDSYRTGLFASAGGEEEYVAVSNEEGEFWSSENNWTASTHYLQTQAE